MNLDAQNFKSLRFDTHTQILECENIECEEEEKDVEEEEEERKKYSCHISIFISSFITLYL